MKVRHVLGDRMVLQQTGQQRPASPVPAAVGSGDSDQEPHEPKTVALSGELKG